MTTTLQKTKTLADALEQVSGRWNIEGSMARFRDGTQFFPDAIHYVLFSDDQVRFSNGGSCGMNADDLRAYVQAGRLIPCGPDGGPLPQQDAIPAAETLQPGGWTVEQIRENRDRWTRAIATVRSSDSPLQVAESLFIPEEQWDKTGNFTAAMNAVGLDVKHFKVRSRDTFYLTGHSQRDGWANDILATLLDREAESPDSIIFRKLD